MAGGFVMSGENIAEATFEEWAHRNGWETTKRGWPDFLAFKDKVVMFVEVKPTASQPLKASQFRVFQLLASAGFECYRYDPTTGLNPYKPGQPRRIAGMNTDGRSIVRDRKRTARVIAKSGAIQDAHHINEALDEEFRRIVA